MTMAVTTRTAKLVSNFEYEFGGPVGALLTTILLPVVTVLLTSWASLGRVDLDGVTDPDVLCPGCDEEEGRLTLLRCAAAVVGWFLFQVLLERFLPCEIVEGGVLKGGPNEHGERRLKYRINGHLAFWATLLFVEVGWPSMVQVGEVTRRGPPPRTVLQFGRAPLGLPCPFWHRACRPHLACRCSLQRLSRLCGSHPACLARPRYGTVAGKTQERRLAAQSAASSLCDPESP